MPIPGERDLIKLGPFPAGANNVAGETSVPKQSFRKGVNVDVDDAGHVARRSGYSLEIAGEEPSGLVGVGARGFYVEGGTLMQFEVVDRQVFSAVEIYSGLRPFARLTHALIEPDIYLSDGDVALRVSPSNEVSLWSLPTATAPALERQAGSLPAGRYRVAVCYRAPSGEEGPLSEPTAIEVEEDSAIRATLIPHPTLRCSVYMTKPGGADLLHLATLPAAVDSAVLNRQALGRPPATAGLDPMPAGAFAALWNGRLLVARDREVYWSEPNHYGLTVLGWNYLLFAEEVTMLAAVETAEGYFVGQGSRTYYISGNDPAQARTNEAYPNGVVPGTMQMVPGARLPLEDPPAVPVPMWLATNGVFCVGMPDGSVFPLAETRFAARVGSEGAAMFDQRAGKNRFVATVRDPADNTFAMSDQFTAEVVRNKITL